MTRKPRVFKLYDVYSDAEDQKLRTERSAEFVEGDVISWFQGLRYIVWPLPVQTEVFVPLSITTKYNNALEHFSEVMENVRARIRLRSNDAGLLRAFNWQPENWEFVDVLCLQTSRACCKIELVVEFAKNIRTKKLFMFDDNLWYSRCNVSLGKQIYEEFERKIGRTRGVIVDFPNHRYGKHVVTLFDCDMNDCLINFDVVFFQAFRYAVPNRHMVCVYNVAESAFEEMLQCAMKCRNAKVISSTKSGEAFERDKRIPEVKMDVVRVRSKNASIWTHKNIVDYSIAFRNFFPPYVLLEILDWLPDVEREEHAKKIATIYSVKQSIEKIFLNKFATDS